MSNSKLQLQVLFNAVDRLTGPLRSITGAARGGSVSMKQLYADQRRWERALKDVAKQGTTTNESLIARTRAYEQALKRTNALIDEQKVKLAAAGQAARRMEAIRDNGMNIAAHGAGAFFAGQQMLGAMSSVVQPTIEMESAMADVRKVVDFESPAAFREMQRDIENLSARIPLARTELAAIVAFGGQAQIPRRELLLFAEDAAQMGVAFGMTGEEAGRAMAQWRTAFSMGRGEVKTLADRINYLGNTGPANAIKITEMVNRVGALGDVAGLAPGPLAAVSASVAAVGVESEIGATGIKNMLLTLTAGASASPRTGAAFRQLGLDATTMARAMNEDAAGAIVTVMERLRALPKEQQAGVMTQLFGRESVGAIAPLLSNLDLLKANLAKVGDESQYAGSMLREFEGQNGTTASSVQRLDNQWQTLKGRMGENMAIQGATEALTGVIERLNQFASDNPRIAGAIGITVAAATILLITFGALAMGIGSFMIVVPHLMTAFGVIRAGWAMLNTAFLMSPWGLLIAGIVVAAVLIYTYWDQIKAAFDSAWASLKAFWDRLGPFGRGLVSIFFPIIGVARLIYNNWDLIKAVFWSAIEQLGQNFAWLKENFAKIISFMPLGQLVSFVTTHWDTIKAIFTGAFDGIVAAFWAFIDTGNTIVTQFRTFGTNIIDGIINGIKAAPGKVKDALLGVIDRGITAVRERLGIASPSRLFMAIGGHVTDGLALGVDRGNGRPLASMARLATGLAGSFAMATTLPAGAASPGGGMAGGVNNFGPVSITINQQPGEDASDLARRVMQEIRLINGREARGSYEDR